MSQNETDVQKLDILEMLKEFIIKDEEKLIMLYMKVSNEEITQMQANDLNMSIIKSIANHVKLFKKI